MSAIDEFIRDLAVKLQAKAPTVERIFLCGRRTEEHGLFLNNAVGYDAAGAKVFDGAAPEDTALKRLADALDDAIDLEDLLRSGQGMLEDENVSIALDLAKGIVTPFPLDGSWRAWPPGELAEVRIPGDLFSYGGQ